MKMKVYWLLVFCLPGWFQCRDNDWEPQEQLKAKIRADACQINHRLQELRQAAGLLAEYTTEVFLAQKELANGLPKADYTQYQGVLHKTHDDGGSAVYYSNRTKLGPRELAKVRFTENLDLLFRPILKNYPLVVQVYLNTFDSMNRIYPYFEVLSQYANDIDIPTFNFYYLADSVHNPTRESVWVHEPYMDPAGRGWMVSAIAPVYVNQFLEGVVGLDITINEVLRQLQTVKTGHELFINRAGLIMAIDESTANLLDVAAPRPVQYLEAVRMDTYTQADLDLLKSRNREVREATQALLTDHQLVSRLTLASQRYFMAIAPIQDIDWLLIELNPIK